LSLLTDGIEALYGEPKTGEWKRTPKKNGLRIIDSDMHIMEPLNLWDQYMEVRFKERAPRPVRVPTRSDLNLLMIDARNHVLQPRPGVKQKSCPTSAP
jgi:hypothetical protein